MFDFVKKEALLSSEKAVDSESDMYYIKTFQSGQLTEKRQEWVWKK